MSTRAERLATERAARKLRCEGRHESLWPNPPCGRCTTPLSRFAGRQCRLVDDGGEPQDHREEYVELCTRCYTALMEWLDLEPAQWEEIKPR